MTNLVSRFVKCESGATAIEYGLIASLIGVAIVGIVSATGGKLSSTFNNVKSTSANIQVSDGGWTRRPTCIQTYLFGDFPMTNLVARFVKV